MKRVVSLILFLCMLGCSFTGCGSGSNSVSSGNVKVIACVSQIDTFMQQLLDQAQQTAQEMGITFDIVNAELNLETQVSQIKSAVTAGYDVIACVPVDRDSALEIEALSGDIPIVFFNSCPDEKHLKAGQYMYVGSDENVAGQYQAEYVLHKFANQSELNVAIIKGPSSHTASKQRTDAVKKTLNESGKTIHYVFEDSAAWSQKQACELFKVFSKTKQSCDVVICNNDDMALGIVDACDELGIQNMTILGVDAIPGGCSAIEQGSMDFTVYQSGVDQGKSVIEAAYALATNGDISKLDYISDDKLYVWVPFQKVDSSNVKDYQ